MNSFVCCALAKTKHRVQQIGRDDFGGASVEEALRRLIDEHWQTSAIAAVAAYRKSDPEDWAEYVDSADERSRSDATVSEPWEERSV